MECWMNLSNASVFHSTPIDNVYRSLDMTSHGLSTQEACHRLAMYALRKMLSPRSSVVRDGNRTTIDSAALVPGDIVLLEAGERVPGDLRLIEAVDLAVEKAALTGESVPVDKSVAPVPLDAVIGDRNCMTRSKCSQRPMSSLSLRR